MRPLTIALSLLLLAVPALPGGARNVLLLIADDYGVDSCSLYNASPGAVLPPTPNLQALKNSGVMFRNAYAHPICSPSRAAILTGRHPFRTGVTTAVSPDEGQLMAAELTLPRAFAAAAPSFALAHFGKWHLTAGPATANDPANLAGWPHYAGCLSGSLAAGGNGAGTYTAWTKTLNGVTGAVNGTTTYATTDTTNDALAWIQAQGAAPWFAWVAYNAPHTPFHKPPAALHTYDTTVANWNTLQVQANQRLHYNAAVEALDTEIGRLLAGIPAAVRADTAVIFVGDNGTPTQVIQTPYSSAHGKGSLYEGGVRVPLIVSGPDVVGANREVAALVHVADLYATILELAGLSPAAIQPAELPVDAVSLMPFLRNQPAAPHLAFIEHAGSTIASNVAGRAAANADGYRLIRFQDGAERLHFLPADPDEQANLLGGALSAPAQQAYTSLAGQLDAAFAPANPLGKPVENSWQRFSGAEYARVYRTQAQALAGNAVTTWLPGGPVTGGGQAEPVYAGVESVRVAASWVYVKGSALPHYTMGPWYFDAAQTQLFANLPSKWDMLARLPRVPRPAATRANTAFGPVAIWVNATIVHNQLDAFYWNGSADVDTSATGLEAWTRNAFFAEGLTFDPAGAHQPFTGESHHHVNPLALRHELNDQVDYNPTTHAYTEAGGTPQHSPILGWAFDGYPIYGPYGHANPASAASGARRMVSGFVPRDGANGTANLAVTGRATLPAWAVRARHGTDPKGAATGPAVSTAFPLGWYLQDYDYLGDRGFTQGADFDLDECNGRWCVTPEFPGGTYAYFVTLNANGSPAFPYILGRQYYGVKQGGNWGAVATAGFTALQAPLETLYTGGPALAPRVATPSVAGNGQVTLTWDAAEGGSYAIESRTPATGWQVDQSGLAAAGPSASSSLPGGAAPTRWFRVRQDGLASHDTVDTP